MTGDLNMWSALIGSDPIQRTMRPDNFNNGDDIMNQFAKNRITNINNGQPTLWSLNINGIKREYNVDTMWNIDELVNNVHITHNFDSNTTITDHYPNHISIQHIG